MHVARCYEGFVSDTISQSPLPSSRAFTGSPPGSCQVCRHAGNWQGSDQAAIHTTLYLPSVACHGLPNGRTGSCRLAGWLVHQHRILWTDLSTVPPVPW